MENFINVHSTFYHPKNLKTSLQLLTRKWTKQFFIVESKTGFVVFLTESKRMPLEKQQSACDHDGCQLCDECALSQQSWCSVK